MIGCYLVYHEGLYSANKLSEEQMVSCLVLQGSQLTKSERRVLNKRVQCRCLLPFPPVMSLIKISNLIKTCLLISSSVMINPREREKKKTSSWTNLTIMAKRSKRRIAGDLKSKTIPTVVTSTNSWAKVSNTLLPPPTPN